MSIAAVRYQSMLARRWDAILPEDAYERAMEVSTQAWLADDHAAPEALRGAGLLFNHLRIPYRKASMAVIRKNGGTAALILAPGLRARHVEVLSRALIVVFDGSDEKRPGLSAVAGGADHLLPHRDGLRSEYALSLIATIHAGLRQPLITGMLPAGVGIRLDDITGNTANLWLPQILEAGWKPNLGLFLNAFEDGNNPCASWFSRLAAEGMIEISPHAFAEDHMLFFDLRRYRSYSALEAEQQWAKAVGIMARNDFPISPVINAHFHVMCPNMANHLAEQGVRYFYSEYYLGSSRITPGPLHWPSGDPIHSTGGVYPNGIIQIAAGDDMGKLMDPSSHYDFLMHTIPGDVTGAAARALQRLRLSLACGFPAYLTSHEFRLSSARNWAGYSVLWQQIEEGLTMLGSPPKVSLGTLGNQCLEHRSTKIWSATVLGDGRIMVELRGHGGSTLRLLGFTQKIVPVDQFSGSVRITI
jgi:hypothetical protein